MRVKRSSIRVLLIKNEHAGVIIAARDIEPLASGFSERCIAEIMQQLFGPIGIVRQEFVRDRVN
jgi:hypothetical protein